MAASDYTGKEKASLANIKEMIENGASLQQIRGAMGLGYSLDVLAAANGGTGVNNLQDVADVIVDAISGAGSGNSFSMQKSLYNIMVNMLDGKFDNPKLVVTFSGGMPLVPAGTKVGEFEADSFTLKDDKGAFVKDGNAIYVPAQATYEIVTTFSYNGGNGGAQTIGETIYFEVFVNGEWKQLYSATMSQNRSNYSFNNRSVSGVISPSNPIKYRLRRSGGGDWYGAFPGSISGTSNVSSDYHLSYDL